MNNAHVHRIFRTILEPLMSKPRTQTELDEQAKLDEQWNAGARQADATWWRQSHEHGAGRTYQRVCIGATRDGVPVYEHILK